MNGITNIYSIIKKEIDEDPEKIGYAGKTNAEIVNLLNNPQKKTKIVEYEIPARIYAILIGIANTSNVVAEKDVIAAKALEVKVI